MKKCDIDKHVKQECENRRIACPLKCRGFIIAKNIEHHMKDTCPNRPQECPYCHILVPYRDLENHKGSCDLKPEECPLKCGLRIEPKNMQIHIDSDCKNRFVICPLKCGMKIREVNLQQHIDKTVTNY